MRKTIVVLIFIISHTLSYCSYQAVITLACVDVIHYQQQPEACCTQEDETSTTLLSPKDDTCGWTRSAQVLFNERVKVLKEQHQHVFISLEQCLNQHNLPLTGWVKKESVQDIRALGKDVYALPLSTQNTLRLVEPWADEVTQTIYSAGTSFVRNAAKDIDPDFYGVYIYDHSQNKVVESLVPHYAIVLNHQRSIDQQRELFSAILKKWCLYHWPIKYLFGGMSFRSLRPVTPTLDQCLYNGQYHECFVALEHQEEILSGFDSSGLIFRAAQIAGMPYSLRNTTAIKNNLSILTERDLLSIGDLLCMKGHVMVVASLHPALLIEAVGYSSGYGKVHMIELQKKFKGVSTWHELLSYYFEKRIPVVLNADGSEYTTNYPITFLRLESLWDEQSC